MVKTVLPILLLFFSLSLGFYGCKKSNNNNSSGGGSTSIGNGNPSGTYYGFMMVTGIDINAAVTTSGTAAFFSTPVPMGGSMKMVGTTTITAGSIGNLPLTYSITPSYYPLGTPFFPPATWNITGAGVIPSFTFTNNDPGPTGPVGPGLLGIGTIHRNQNLSVSLSGSQGADQAIVSVSDSTNKQISVFVSAAASSVFIPRDSLSKLHSCYSASISLSLIKYNIQTLGGKPFLFATCFQMINPNISIQ